MIFKQKHVMTWLRGSLSQPQRFSPSSTQNTQRCHNNGIRSSIASLRKREEETSTKLKAENLILGQADDILANLLKLSATFKERDEEREEILTNITPLIIDVSQQLRDVENKLSQLDEMNKDIKELQKANYELAKLISSNESSLIDRQANIKAYEEAENFEV